MKEEKKGLAGFFEKWGAFIAIGLVVIALVFLLTSPVVTFDTKFKPEGAEKAIKNYYSATFIGLFDSKVTPAWPAITIASLLGLGVIANLVSYFWKKYHDAVSVGATFAYILAVAMIFIEKDLPPSREEIAEAVRKLGAACDTCDDAEVRKTLQEIVPSYHPN
jgi:hypothetical protein